MAFRRRQIITRTSAYKDDDDDDDPTSSSSSSSSLAAQTFRAARRDSSYSPRSPQGPTYDYRALKTTNDQAGGFWNVLARTAKSVLDEDNSPKYSRPNQMAYNSTYFTNDQYYHSRQSNERSRPVENPSLRKGLDALTSSFNKAGGTTKNALEEGPSMAENKSSDILQESRSMQLRRKGPNLEEHNQASGLRKPRQEPTVNSAQPRVHTNQQTQLKASRDVAMATATKAKLLLRELKTVKSDLALSRQRCAQLEEENKMLREVYDEADHPADDDMIRLQLETLLAEKARLAHENSVFARENRFLREVVEYHQLTMQDVLYEETTEFHPVPPVSRRLSVSPPQLRSPTPEKSPSRSSAVSNKSSHGPLQLQAVAEVVENEAPPDSTSPGSSPETAAGHPNPYAA